MWQRDATSSIAALGKTLLDEGRTIIRALSERGVLLGTAETATLPAHYAATSPHAERGGFYGPRGLGHLGGPPAEQRLYGRLRSAEEAQRIWRVSEELTRVPIR
ncbi:MAG TPA: hypothetical protein VFV01_00145 [Spirillospora sp.]|nr:hypothetical protein [Spirillospora sp.]